MMELSHVIVIRLQPTKNKITGKQTLKISNTEHIYSLLLIIMLWHFITVHLMEAVETHAIEEHISPYSRKASAGKM